MVINMKKSLRTVLSCLGIFIALILSLSLWWYFKTSHYTSDETRKKDLTALKSQDYNCLLLSMYSVENLDEENFIYFRGIPTLKAGHSFETLKDIGDYLESAYESGQDITSIYMGIDPAIIARQYGHHASLYHPEYEKRLVNYITEHPDTHFEFLLPYYSLTHWLEMSEAEQEEAFTAYQNFINIFSGHPNVTLYFFGHEDWLIAGHGNYETYNTCNESVTSTLLAMTIRDDTYRITAENMEERFNTLEKLISRTSTDFPTTLAPMPYLYNLSDYEFVFFGDSVIGNYTDSLSVPGVVAGNGNTKAYNLAQGGTTATMVDGTDTDSSADSSYGEPGQSLQTVIDAFLAQNPSLLSPDSQPHAGLTAYLNEHARAEQNPFFTSTGAESTTTTGTSVKTCFVINYGLNDYFEGQPVYSADPEDIYTYQGSLRTAVQKLTAAYPDCTILLQTPNFCSYYENGTERHGTDGWILEDYVSSVIYLTDELSGEYPVYCVDNYHVLDIDATNHGEYLSDGCHPNEKGRFQMGMHILEWAFSIKFDSTQPDS
ncbi:MAG: SGNH/GDSL hydrolase family protein [Lachnospiraceae bacterium]|nr:SGNH/GDSL hydrolase family protein [Lachnospiraceae bacterium]